jgi:hypothetical protein
VREGSALRRARRIELVGVAGFEELGDERWHAAKATHHVVLRRHHHDAAVWLLGRYARQVGGWILRIAVADDPQHAFQS